MARWDSWPLAKRAEHSDQCERELARHGVTYDRALRLVSADPQVSPLALAEQIANAIACRMEGLPYTLPEAPQRPGRALIAQATADDASIDVWVSSDLLWFTCPRSHRLANDVRQVDADKPRTYRRLDVAYYAWLHRRMDEAKALHDRGEISPMAWEIARQRFAQIWLHATERWPTAVLDAALAQLPATYQPPARAA